MPITAETTTENVEGNLTTQVQLSVSKEIKTIEDVFAVQDSLRTRVRNLVRYLDENLPVNVQKEYVLRKADELVALATESLMAAYNNNKHEKGTN